MPSCHLWPLNKPLFKHVILSGLVSSYKLQCNLNYLDLVYPKPWLSRLAGHQKIHYHACAEGLANDLLWVCVVTGWTMSYRLYRLALAKTDWPEYFSEYCWPWSYCIGVVYRLGIIIEPGEKFSTSVFWTFYLPSLIAISLWTKGFGLSRLHCIGKSLISYKITWQVQVPKPLVGFVIGRNGEHINNIQNTCGVRLQFQNGTNTTLKIICMELFSVVCMYT